MNTNIIAISTIIMMFDTIGTFCYVITTIITTSISIFRIAVPNPAAGQLGEVTVT